MEIEETPPIVETSNRNSNGEYMDAEGYHENQEELSAGELYQEVIDPVNEQRDHRIISQLLDGSGTRTRSALSPDDAAGQSNDLANSVESLALSTSTSVDAMDDEMEDYQNDSIWQGQKKHVFVLSDAGKPIYSLHGNEDKLVTLFGLIQVLVSTVQDGQDTITSLHADKFKIVFLHRNSLILVVASRSSMSVPQLHLQLSDVYYQILSTLTLSHMRSIFGRRKNFDLRRLLNGSERFIYNLLTNDSNNGKVSNNVFTFLTNTIRVFPLSTSVRSTIVSAIQSNCSKIKDIVFAVLIADKMIISLVRLKKCSIQPTDLRLIINLVECSESFKVSENWTPICLPNFRSDGYLYAHVSYLADDCPACLMLMSTRHEDFHPLSEAKERITAKLRRSQSLQAIIDELQKPFNIKMYQQIQTMPELRHFLYKPTDTAQLLCPMLRDPYTSITEFERLEAIYCSLLHRVHKRSRPLKLIYEVKDQEVVFAWLTAQYELYAVFESIVERTKVIGFVDNLIKWIQKEYDIYFIRNHPTF